MSRNKIVASIAACAFFVLAGQSRPALAADATEGASMYVSGFIGLSILPDSGLNQPTVFTSDFQYDTGIGLAGAIGYKWPMGLRSEIELSYRQNAVDFITFTDIDGTVSGPALNSHVGAFAFMANLWYDFDTDSELIPHIGGGIGGATITYDFNGSSEHDTVFAWQLGFGLGYQVTPGVVLFTDYRWLATTDSKFSDPGFPDVIGEYSSHNILFGARAHF